MNRDLNKEELKKFYLSEQPIFEGSLRIFHMESTDDSIYRLYYGGTNRLVLLKYGIDKDMWVEIKDFVDNNNLLYRLLYHLCVRLDHKKMKVIK